jgi:hypothetical protein
MLAIAAERRTENRRRFGAGVRLRVSGLLPREVTGRLVDISSGGFRAVHADRDLAVGDRVGFAHPRRRGEAVVVWIRIADGSIVSGFRVLESLS